MPIRLIDTSDFVNAGREKVNESLGEIPVGFDIDTDSGELVITKHNTQILRVPLANVFGRLQSIVDLAFPSYASHTQSGLIQLGDEENPADLDSETKVLAAAAMVRYIESVTENLPDFSTLIEGAVPVVGKKGDKLYVNFVSGADYLKAQNTAYFEYICAQLTKLGCAGGSTTPPITPPDGKTIIGFVGIDGPDAIDEGVLTSQFLAIVTYNDGTTGKLVPTDANGFVRSIVGQGETISATGIVPIYSNQVSGDTRQFTVRIGYKLPGQIDDTVRTKVVTVNDKSVSQDIVLGDVLMPYYVDNSATAHDHFGLYDGVDCAGGVRGFALDFIHPNTPVVLEILRDGVVKGEITVDRTRSDVSDYYGITNTTGHIYGFIWPIPDNLKDSQAHTYTARFKGTTTLLSTDGIAPIACIPPDNAACPNLALLSKGGTASASSTYNTGSNGFSPDYAFNGDRTGNGWGLPNNPSGWNSDAGASAPQTLYRDLGTMQTIAEIELVLKAQNAAEPTESQQDDFVNPDFDIQYLNGSQWVTFPGGSIRGNKNVIRRVRLGTPIAFSQLRVTFPTLKDGYARIVELILRACLTGPADSPSTIKITNGPAHQAEGSGIDLIGEIRYSDGRVDQANPSNSTWQLAAATGDYDAATGTHAATASGATLGNNGRFTVAANSVRGDGRTVRIKLSAYGLSDTVGVIIDDTTPAPTGSITQIGRAFVGTGGPSGAPVRDILYFVKNGVTPTGATGEGPVYGYRNINTSTGNLDAANEMYSVDSYPFPAHWKSAADAAKAAGYKWFAYANIGDAGQTVRFRFRGKASLPTTENQDFDYVGPADGVNVALSTIYPAQ